MSKQKNNVLSLFDGYSGGQIALQKNDIKIGKYYASEIDVYAQAVTQHNYPNTIQLGDVEQWRDWNINWSSIDILIGGSPCQGFSFAGKRLAFDDPRSKLFFVYVDILNHIKTLNPNVIFLLENVKMKKEYLAVISQLLDVEPILINSSLVSAQNRQRYYWTNIIGVIQPVDKELFLKDIIDYTCNDVLSDGTPEVTNYAIYQRPRGNNKGGIKNSGKSPTLTSNSWEQNNFLVMGSPYSPVTKNEVTTVNPRKSDGTQTYQQDRVYCITGKFPCLSAQLFRFYVCDSTSELIKYRKLTPIECERLQTLPDNYTLAPHPKFKNKMMSKSQRYKMIGNGFTVDVIAHIFSKACQLVRGEMVSPNFDEVEQEKVA